jgi:hypothetical protein
MGVLVHPPFFKEILREDPLCLLKKKVHAMIFYGIADAHGLESFIPSQFTGEIEGFQIPPKDLSLMGYRAQANRHRHAVVYQVDIPLESAKEALELFNKGEYSTALELVKEKADSVSLMKIPGAEKSWKLIPNPDLDPYS